MDIEILRKRSDIINKIRLFFQKRGYLEVETPILSPDLIPESTIEIFETLFASEFHGQRQLYLIPSPEIHMKKLLAEGSGDIFQITKSFRNSEQCGRIHNPEFTMLEWYTVNADYLDSIDLTEELFSILTEDIEDPSLKPPFYRKSVNSLFVEKLGLDLNLLQNPTDLRNEAGKLGIEIREPESWEDTFNRIFLTFIEPELPLDKPVALYDYPAHIKCLAKEIPGTPFRERWELYVKGIELANCYTEETDSKRVKRIMESEYAKKAASAGILPDLDTGYWEIFDKGFPPCSGVALGIDRLVMMLTETDSIGGVILFPLSDILGNHSD